MFSRLFRKRQSKDEILSKKKLLQLSLGSAIVEQVLIFAQSNQVENVAFGPGNGADDSLVFVYHLIGDEYQQVGSFPIETYESEVLPIIKLRCRPTDQPDSPILSIQPFPDKNSRGVKILLA